MIRERPDDVAGVIRAFYRAVRFAQEHPEEAWQIMSARERVTPEDFARRCSPASRWCRSPISRSSSATGRACQAVVARVSQVLKEKGLLSGVHAEHDLLNAHPAALAVEP